MKIENEQPKIISLPKTTLVDQKRLQAEKPKDTVEISDFGKVFQKVDDFLNLGKKERMDISELNETEKEEYLRMVSKLADKGVVGYETFEINGQKEKHFLANQIGNKRLYGAKPKQDKF